MPTASVKAFAIRLRNAQARRLDQARTTAQQDLLRRWATALLEHRELNPAGVVRAMAALQRTGLSEGMAESVVAKSLGDAMRAFQAGLIHHGAEAASDSENTDTGRFQRI